MLRAFIAIQLSDELKCQIGELQSELRRQAPEASGLAWVKPEGVHLTLKFLGDIEENQVPLLTEALRRSAATVKPFRFELARVGVLPDLRFPKVLFAAVGGEEGAMQELMKLQAAVEAEALVLGFPQDGRPFRPHLTLARVRDRKAAAPLLNLRSLQNYADRVFGALTVNSVVLVRSDLRPGGALYTSLVEVPLSLQV